MVKRSFSLIMAIVLIGCLTFSALAVDAVSYDVALPKRLPCVRGAQSIDKVSEERGLNQK